MILPPEIQSFVLAAVVTAAMSTFGFLVKRAFGDLAEGLKELKMEVGGKLDLLASSLNQNNTEVAVLQARVERLENELDRLRADMREIKEG